MPFTLGKGWSEVPLSEIDQKVYGRTAAAYRHKTGGMLIHHKWLSKQSKMHHKCGMWYCCYGNKMIRRKAYYNCIVRVPPWKWAEGWITKHLTGESS